MARVVYKYSGAFGRAAGGSGALVKERMGALGDEMRSWIVDQTPKFTGESRDKTRSRVSGQSTRVVLIISGEAPHALFSQQRGRKPGKFPPPLIMLNYVQKGGITFEGRVVDAKRRGFINRPRAATPQVNVNIRLLRKRRALIEREVAKKIRGVNTPELRKQKAVAFLIGRAIARRGVRGRLLFTRVLFVKRGAINRTRAEIEKGIARLINA